MDELERAEFFAKDVDAEQSRGEYAYRQALLLTAISQAKSTRESAAALTTMASTLTEIVGLLRQIAGHLSTKQP